MAAVMGWFWFAVAVVTIAGGLVALWWGEESA